MRALARVLVLCLSISLACACAVADEDGGTDENAGTGESDESTDEADEATDTDGGTLPWEEFQGLCEQQSSREACEAVPGASDPGSDTSGWCAWVVEAPAQLDGDTCIFGAPISECRAISTSGDIGCASGSIEACSIEELGWSRMDGDTLLVGRGAVCEFSTTTMPCTVSPSLGVVGEPECACLCDPGFPL